MAVRVASRPRLIDDQFRRCSALQLGGVSGDVSWNWSHKNSYQYPRVITKMRYCLNKRKKKETLSWMAKSPGVLDLRDWNPVNLWKSTKISSRHRLGAWANRVIRDIIAFSFQWPSTSPLILVSVNIFFNLSEHHIQHHITHSNTNQTNNDMHSQDIS